MPPAHIWAAAGLTLGEEIHSGHQSRVFIAVRDGAKVAVKLTDRRLVDDAFHRRIEMLASLAEANASVVGPLKFSTSPIVQLDEWLAVAYPFVAGRALDLTDQADVRRMAATLARLHGSLDRLGPVDLPVVAALRDVDWASSNEGFGRFQLLHGDFSDANALGVDGSVRVIDFDDCGYGPVEFEVGNTLYMVLFNASMSSRMQRYEQFRSWFVDEYRSASGREITDTALDSAIRLRVEALSRWIDRPQTAPIGIRTATPEWRESLRAFVHSTTDH